jgi:hypothetical protein
MTIISVDPGKTGAVAVRTDDVLVEIIDMPTLTVLTGKSKLVIAANNTVSKKALTKTHVCAVGIFEKLFGIVAAAGADVRFVMEKVHEMPGQSGMFAFGRSSGLVEMAAISLGLLPIFVEPSVWKRSLGLGSDKNRSRELAGELFPAFTKSFRRVEDDGRAEAALIGEWLARSQAPKALPKQALPSALPKAAP